MSAVEIEKPYWRSPEIEKPYWRSPNNRKETTLKRLRKGESNKSDLTEYAKTSEIHIATALPE